MHLHENKIAYSGKSLYIVYLAIAQCMSNFSSLKNFLYNEQAFGIAICPNMYEQCCWDVIKSWHLSHEKASFLW